MFSIGAFGYGLIEVLWRGYTHWSMLGAGGICFMGFGAIADRMKQTGLFIKSLVGSGMITMVEFCFGVVFNLILKKNVWDYSKLPLNVGGQVCALYSFFWMVLSLIFIPLASLVSRRLQKNESLL